LEFSGTERYLVRRRVGAGGFGVVFEVYDRERGVRLALKTVRVGTPEALFRLKREFRALQDLHHPNLVKLVELSEVHGRWFFTMDFVDGKDLLTYVREGCAPIDRDQHDSRATLEITPQTRRLALGSQSEPGPVHCAETLTAALWDESRLRSSFAQLARGLTVLHSAGKIHCDIKPSNVLVDREDHVVLLDFGLVADVTASTGSRSGARFFGTPAYAAPELALAPAAVGPPADWYGVGVMLYEALTGRLPFRGSAADILYNKRRVDPVAPRSRASGVPADLEELCLALLRRTPSERPTAAEVVRCLEGAAAVEFSGGVQGKLPFVGREPELDLLAGAAFESRRQATCVVMRGESGIGKTTILSRFASQRAENGALVLYSRCYQRESVPYKAVDGLVDELADYLASLEEGKVSRLLPKHVSALARVFPVLRRAPGVDPRGEPESSDPHAERERAFDALRSLLAVLAETRPVLLVIDDLQWTDRDSLELLAHVLAGPDAPRALLVAALRPDGDFGDGVTLDQVQGSLHPATIIELTPLTAVAAHELAKSLLGGREELAALVAREAAGHPLFTLELARLAPAAARAGSTNLDKVLWSRIEPLAASARELIEVVSVAHSPLRAPHAAAAARITPSDFSAEMAALRSAHLVRGGCGDGEYIEPYHDRVRSAVLSNLPTARLRALHQRIAEALERAQHADPEALATHWAGAGEAGRAAVQAARAAEQATRALAFDLAARHYRWAVELAEKTGGAAAVDSGMLREHLAEALSNAGRTAESAAAYLAAARQATPRENALHLSRCALDQLFSGGHLSEGNRLLEELCAQLGLSQPSGGLRLLAKLRRNRRARLRIDLRDHTRWVRKQPTLSRLDQVRMEVCWDALIGLGFVDLMRAASFVRHHLDLAVDSGDARHIFRALLAEATYAAARDSRSAEVRSLVNSARALLPAVGDPAAPAILHIVEGFFAMIAGDWMTAETMMRSGQDVLLAQPPTRADKPLPLYYFVSVASFGVSSAMSRQGKLRDWDRIVPPLLRQALSREDVSLATHLLTGVTAVPRLALGRVGEATEAADRAVSYWPCRPFQLPHVLDLEARTNIELYCGNATRARAHAGELTRRLARTLLVLAQYPRIVALDVHGRAALAMAERANGLRRRLLAREADFCGRRLLREGNAWSICLGLLIRAGAAAQRGERQVALELLNQARAHFRAAHMLLHEQAVEFVRAGLDAHSADRPGGQAEALARLGCVEPVRVVRMLAPGFEV
jgi:hypothetical protein